MSTMIMIEGITVKAASIPRKQLMPLWKTLTSKPFPKVKAFQVGDSDFERLVQVSKSRDDGRRERQEWGRVLSPEGTDAFVYKPDEFVNDDYIILIRENPYHSLGEILEHELSHIARGDL